MSSSAETAHSSLQLRLDEITSNTRALVPPERLAGTEQMVMDLQATGLETSYLPAGTAAPEFDLQSANGKRVRSSDLLALGPLVLKFFRGRWDPYDMTELEVWQSLQPILRQHRTLFVAISPQTVRQSAFTADRHHLTFPVLSDPRCALAAQFGLAYTVSLPAQRHYRSMLVNVPFLNGEDSWQLPLPGTFLLQSDRRILYATAFADHRRRPEPEEVLTVLSAGGDGMKSL